MVIAPPSALLSRIDRNDIREKGKPRIFRCRECTHTRAIHLWGKGKCCATVKKGDGTSVPCACKEYAGAAPAAPTERGRAEG